MQLVFHGLNWKECLAYLDDKMIKSFKHHLANLGKLFSLFSSAQVEAVAKLNAVSSKKRLNSLAELSAKKVYQLIQRTMTMFNNGQSQNQNKMWRH